MLTRRGFIGTAAAGWVAGDRALTGPEAVPPVRAADPARVRRIRGLLLGTFIGDALGGPIEFQPREAVSKLENPPKQWQPGEKLDSSARAAAVERLRFQWRNYTALRPTPEPYAHWSVHAPAGTITDDSRHKLVLLDALREALGGDPVDVSTLAQAYLAWPLRPELRAREGWSRLRQDWLTEWWYACRWVLGERDLARARPPERMWNGLATCCGQMTSLPLACVFAGAPDQAYQSAFGLGFFDNGWGRDLNAAFIAGLSVALVLPEDMDPMSSWKSVVAAMRSTDPYGHAQIPWCQRSVERWLGLAERLVLESKGEPARLFAGLDREFRDTVKWEAQVPLTVMAACWELAGGDALTALTLTLEWGHDTDSYAQIAGALAGALHGPEIFPVSWRSAVEQRLLADYRVSLEAEVDLLATLQTAARTREVVRGIART
jgi:ADP-ribosylglycohydrolase